MRQHITVLLAWAAVCRAWLPGSMIRGVNLGSLFIIEKWMAEEEWKNMGCGDSCSEFDCVSLLGQDTADQAFRNHWATWITEDDFDQMQRVGLNAVRIPVGYWMKEDLVYADSEHFPRGGIEYLDKVVGWASARNFYIVIDLHGAPGAQTGSQPSTGQCAPSPGFFQDYQYERAYSFLEWMTDRIHTNDNYTGVGMIEVVNEPVQDTSQAATMISEFYPKAYDRIRAAEEAVGVASEGQLHIQMMSESYGSGNPRQSFDNAPQAAYDDHRYLKYASPTIDANPSAYLAASCQDDRRRESPMIVGEWSLSPPDDVQWSSEWDPSSNVDFYRKWWAAQVMAYEKSEGWFFWSWKAQLGDYRWSYQDAVAAGAIPTSPDDAQTLGACS